MFVQKKRTREKPVEFFVAPDGNDRWPGRIAEPREKDGPFATIERARRAVRALKKRGPLGRPVRVTLRGGIYFLDRALVFGPADAGTHECHVTYAAASGETPIVSGGRRIEGWRETELKGRRAWVADVPEVEDGRWRFRALFVNGERRPRTRLPKRGFHRVKRILDRGPCTPSWACPTKRFEYAPGDIEPWRNLADVEVVAITRWIENRLPIARLDTRRRIVTFDRASRHTLLDEHGDRGAIYWVENVFEALDTPGQWYLDRANCRLYYLPKRGEKIETAEVIAPRLPQVLRIQGRRNRKVAHLNFAGITFSHTEWDLPPDWPGSNQAANEVPGAVFLRHAHDCRIAGGAVQHVGTYGVEVAAGCMDVVISHNRITDLGAGGVKLGHDSMRTTVADNDIGHGGRIFPSAVGVWIGHSPGNKILHNHIHDLFYTGISVGWVWGYAETRAVGNIIEYNHVHDIGHGLLSDVGGIYTLGVSPGTRIRFNLFHDVNCRRYGGWGIYTDEGSTDILIEKNIAHRCNSAPFHQHYGRDNLIVNNIFAFGRDSQIERSRTEDHRSFIFRRNIVYYDRGELLGRNWDPPQADLDHNLYFDASGRPVTFQGKTLEQWQALGMDAGSLVADPLFVDPANGDFTLRRGSPAARIGFEPFDPSSVGPRPISNE